MSPGLVLTCAYYLLTLIRPQDLFPDQTPPNTMAIVGIAALVVSSAELILPGRQPRIAQPTVLLVVLFMGWSTLSVVAALRWLGGGAWAFQALATNTTVFFLALLQGTSLARLRVLRSVILLGLLATAALSLSAYYGGNRDAEYVLTLPARPTESGGGGRISQLVERLMGRDASPARDADAPSEPLEGAGDVERPAFVVRRLRALGFLNDPNDYAQILVSMIPLLLLGGIRRRPYPSFLTTLATFGVFLWCIALTRSRGGVIALASLAWIALVRRLDHRWATAGQAALLVGLLAAMGLALSAGDVDDSALGRVEAWSEGIQMLKASPIWGVGFGQFNDVNTRAAHNSFVNCFAETGLVGYFLWLGAIIAANWSLSSTRTQLKGEGLDSWALSLQDSMVGFFVAALFLSRTYSVTLFLLLGLCCATVNVASHDTDAERLYVPPLALVSRTLAVMAGSLLAVYALVIAAR